MTKAEYAVWGVVAAALAAVVALGVWARRSPPPAAPAAPPAESGADRPPKMSDAFDVAGVAEKRTTELLASPAGELGEFPCVERSGRAANTSELRGKFVVADLIFTNCGGPCPAMTTTMADLQKALKGADDVVLVSFSVDPERDTPKVLSDYADRYGADKDRWLFLRAELPQLREIAYDELHLVASRDEPVIHSQQFALIDRDGKIRAYYSPMSDPDWKTKLLADLGKLRGGPAK
jgi:cytochrome oxidase Cu insertion factor (SCO1/SenC/PrrC family)